MRNNILRRALLGTSLAFVLSAAAAFDIYQLPMFATGAATPNVMLLVDNSGSMNNIIWHDGFDVATTYPTGWGFDPNEGNYHIVSIDNDQSCAGGAGRRVVRGGKTLCLPNPTGGTSTSTDTRYNGNYLNYLFENFASDANALPPIPNETRMQVARAVATDVVSTVTGLRFGLATFNGGCNSSAHGGTILRGCTDASATHISNLTNDIADLDAENNTPLSEAVYEITRYFRGLGSHYHCSGSGITFTSPLQYRCQKNFTIAITDGFPTNDTTFPSNDPADMADASRALPNWDGLAPATTQSQYPLFPEFSDGFQPQSGFSQASEGWSLYLDDIAKFGFDIDMKTTGNDLDGVSWNDPEFPKQNMTTYTVGFAVANQMLQDAADYSGGQYFTASNAAELKAALEEVLLDIQNKATAAASVSLNSTRLDTNLLIYQARFDSSDWSGDLQAYDVNSDGSVGGKVWSANERIPAPASRVIVTQKSSPRTGIGAAWANLTAGQQNALKIVTEPGYCASCNPSWCNGGGGTSGRRCRLNCSICNPDITGRGDEVLAYLLGDRSDEVKNGGDFRDRSTVLGDIVNSDPLFVGTPDFGYHVLPGTEGSSYTTFRAGASYANRPDMVYVGANDGMLHAIDGSETGGSAGVERFAYIPLAVYPKLKELINPSYAHRFYVDGSPQAGDAHLGGAWKTVLVGTLGAGGRGVFALDITNPASFGPSNVLWDKAVTGDTNVNVTDDADLGYTYGQASIARMANGQWAAVLGNGLNSNNHRAVLFIYNLETGALIKKIDTGVGNGTNQNGLSTPVIVDINNDKITDYVYAGDMRGNLWKFDVTGSGSGSWDVAYTSGSTKLPLFTATAPDGTVQPITSKPTVTRRPDGDLMVFFGTGKYFEEVDRRVVSSPAPQVQTFYGVRDPGVAIGGGRGTLAQQSVILTTNQFGFDLRVTSAVEPTPAQNGWYLDLPTAGERQVSRPILRTGRIIFTTVIPNSDACHAGGESWLMELDALSGSRLAFTPFDLTGDKLFNEADYVTVTIDGQDVKVPVSGKKSGEGVIKTPGIVQAGDVEYKYASGSTGGIEVTIEPGDIGAGRQSWRQLR
jgi:type IV pilus assembly protein PilY1